MTWRRLLAITMLLAAPLSATARLTDIAKDFVSRTRNFSATRVMAPPAASGSYLMSMFINQPSGSLGTITATLWGAKGGGATEAGPNTGVVGVGGEGAQVTGTLSGVGGMTLDAAVMAEREQGHIAQSPGP